MKVNFLVNLLLIISALHNHLTVTVYAYKDPLAYLWNVSYSELPRLLSYEKNLKKVDGLLEALLDQYDASVGGTFIDVPTNKIHINVLNDKVNVVKHALKSFFPQYNDLFVYEPVKNSIAALKRTFDQILNIANRTRPFAFVCYISTESNLITLISSLEYEPNRVFLDAIRQISQFTEIVELHIIPNISNIQPPFITTNNMEIDTINNPTINTRILAGDGMKHTRASCSLGFWAKSKDLKSNYVITAAHCASAANDPFYYRPWDKDVTSVLIGSFELKSLTTFDAGLISVDNEEIAKHFNEAVIIRNTDSENNKELIVDDVATVTSYGAHLCNSGYTTHVSCGNVIGINGFFINEKRHLQYPLFISTAKGTRGDSGGPVFSYKQNLHVSLNGILLASGTINGKRQQVYMPVEEILKKFGLKLISSGSSSSSSNTSHIRQI